ncbi:MAG: tRNA 2-selenouridine(34) synthase MnmH [Thiohalospira sp.]
MAIKINIQDFTEKTKTTPVIDVRSPKEFETGHIPGAVNIPIFNDEERAVVGTVYKQQGKETAIFKGLEIVGTKLRTFAEQAREIAKNNKLLIYCWRGGMRSASMAWLFETVGLTCSVLNGGYKAYRKYGKNQLTKSDRIVILGGYTGSGKTELLRKIKEQGQQVLDLERLANHKGSAFGALGQEKQPVNEQFENLLIHEWLTFDLSKPVWVEDESHSIGSNWIPRELFDNMRKAPVIKIELDKNIRVHRLVKEYALFDTKQLENCILKISKRLGGQHAKKALESLNNGEFTKAAEITLNYYDKSYNFGLNKRDKNSVYNVNLKTDNPEKNAEIIIEFARKNIFKANFSNV